MQAVLIIGGGILPSYLVRQAQAMGLYTIVTGASADAPACVLADEHYVLDPLDGDGHAKLAAGLRDAHACQLRGVCTAGADVAPTVSKAAAAAGLPGIPVDIAHRTHDKARVRRALACEDLHCYQPAWLSFYQVVADPGHRIGYPCVVKPVSQRASRGLTIVQHPDALAEACHKALTYNHEYLIEECLTGTEHSAEAIFGEDGTPIWFNIVDRMFSYAGGVAIETGHCNPSRLGAQAQQQIQLMLLSVARALGVQWGAFKLDVMMTTEGPKVLEATARLSGGFDCQGTSPLTGRHPMRQLLQLSCDLPVEPQGPPQATAACAAILPHVTGVVTWLPPPMSLVPEGAGWGLAAVLWTIQAGDQIAPATHNGERAGYVLVCAESYDLAWERARDIAATYARHVQVIPAPLEVPDEQCPANDPAPRTV